MRLISRALVPRPGALVLTQPLCAADVIKPTLDVQDMRVVVSYVSIDELVQLQWKYGAHIDRRELRQDYRHGFSISEDQPRDGRKDV